MSYEITIKGKKDIYTVPDEQGERLKSLMQDGRDKGMMDFGDFAVRFESINTIKHVIDPMSDKSRLLEDMRYAPPERTPEEIKSMREVILKHTKDLKEKGILPKDKVFDVEKEVD